jgi:hypothetical protein
VLTRPLRTVVLAAAIAAAPCAASASEPPVQNGAGQARDGRAQRQSPELICRSVEIAGATGAPLVCMTAADWRRAAEQ